MKNSLPVLAAAATVATFFAVSCAENPADDVPAADVSESTEAPTAAAESAAAAAAATETYVFTPASTIDFTGSKVTGSHSGGFKSFEGTFVVAGDKPGKGPHKIVIDMTSTWSDNEKLTGHLKSPDFFDVEKFPTSTFELSDVKAAEGDNAYTMNGQFTLHGVTKQIAFPATVVKGDDGKVSLAAEFAINRSDFGIVYPGKRDDLIREEVVIKLAMVAEPAE